MLKRILSVVLGVLLALPAIGQVLANRVPADAIVYVGWAGADEMGPAYAKSHLAALMADSAMPQVFSDLLPALAKRIAREDAEAGEIFGTVLAVADPLWRRPCALYFGGVDFANKGNPMPRFAFVCDGGNKPQDVLKAINDALGKANAPFKAELQAERFVVLSMGMPVPADLAKLLKDPAGAASLAKDAAFAESIRKTQAGGMLTFYCNVESLVKMADQGMAQEAPEPFKETWQKIRKSLALDGIKRMAVTAGFDGADWALNAYVEAPAPRQGLAALFDAKPLSEASLKTVPRSVCWAAAGQFDLGKLVGVIRTLSGEIDPSIPQEIDKFLAEAKKATGVDIEKDLLASLGSEWVIYASDTTGGPNMMALTVVNKCNDAAKLKSSLEKLQTWVNKLLQKEVGKEITISTRTVKIGGDEIHYLAIPAVAPAWTIKDGFLVAGLYPQTVASAAGHIGTKGASILDNPGFVQMRKRLGVENPTSISFYDLPKTTPATYGEVAFMFRLMLGLSDMFGVPAPEPVVPPLDKLMGHMATAGSAAWSDDKGFYARSVSPFPMAEMFATQSNMSTMQYGMMAAMMMPALGSAKERAERVKCASNLRQIGLAVQLYRNDKKKYPATLGDLVGEDLPAEVFICPETGKAVPADIAHDKKKYAEWVNANSDYVYLGATMKAADGADKILVYEKLENHNGEGVNVLFNDGHVEWMMQEGAKKAIEEQTKK
ncbi:MAG: DUF3352 domain-containing protein [Tepidisphaeraceae bacterium]|jgi:prepilin-type processing-associated H-X9-DG protein